MSIITYSMKKDWNKKLSKNFCAYEFACNDRSDEFKVATELVETLQQIRDHFGKPVLISSAYRTPAYNISIGAVLAVSIVWAQQRIFTSMVLTRFVLHYT